MCLSLSETEVFARRKPVLVEKTGTGESSDGAEPFSKSLIWTIIQFYLNKEGEVDRQRDCRMQGLDL